MSLYDELRCEYPLPDGFKPNGRLFQTKDTPEQYLASYLLTKEGILCDSDGAPLAFHGALCFYTSNIAGASQESCITEDDTPPWEAEYVALFDHGTLLKVEGMYRLVERPHLTRAEFFPRTHE